ncbi:MAG: glycosyltransferase family 39 protein [Anaerolineae bacterium]|nr:glycosyltransferase family 39 protein [Anaerolineae bacterium]
MKNLSNPVNLILFSAIVAMYLALSLYQIDLPGLHYDEAFEAVPAVQILQGQPTTVFRESGLRIGGQVYPLMTQDYIGAINTYLAIPFIILFGPTPAALRVMSVLVGVVTLGLSYLLAYHLTGARWVGLVASVILATDPTFVFWNRQGVFVTAVTAPIALAAVLCWLQRWRSGQWRWSIFGAFLFGLGLYAKVLFLWMIAALTASTLVLSLPWLIHQRSNLIHLITKKKTLLELALALLAFVIGCWPLIVYNIQTGGTLSSVSENAFTSYYGVNNLAIIPNLIERFSQFITVITGGHLWYLGDIATNWVTPLLLGVVVIFVVITTIRNKLIRSNAQKIPPHKIALFPIFVVIFVILASIGTVSALWVTHFAILMPWTALVIAVGSWFLLMAIDTLPRFKTPARLFVWLGIILLVVTNLSVTLRYHAALTKSGGLSTHSDAIYDLSDWLHNNAKGLVVAMDWGLAAPITYLTNGQVTPVEVFGYGWQSDVQLLERLNGFIAQPEALYLWRAPDEIIFDRSNEFKALYRSQNLEETIEEAFYEKSGRPILGVTRLVIIGTASNPPQ